MPARDITQEFTSTPVLGTEAILERCSVKELKQLCQLQNQGWKEKELDNHFEVRREMAMHPTNNAKFAWFYKNAQLMQELDDAATFIPRSGSYNFLDLGCAPGGMSSHVLRLNPDARGVGISLPEEKGGYTLLLGEGDLQRYEHLEHDLLEYNLSPVCRPGMVRADTQLLPAAYFSHFQLVIADAQILRAHRERDMDMGGSEDLSAGSLGASRSALIVAQIIIALSSVAPGGTLVFNFLGSIQGFPAAHLVHLLDTASETLTTHKPRAMYATRSSFYVVAKGVWAGDRAALKERYLEELRALWHDIRYGGVDGGPRGMLSTDLDFIITAEKILDIEGYLDRLVELGRPLWATQADALRGFFRRKGMQGAAGAARGARWPSSRLPRSVDSVSVTE